MRKILEMVNVGIIGCGNLGSSILKGIQNMDEKIQIYASRRNIEGLLHLKASNTVITMDNRLLIAESDILILALKPYTVLPFLKEHAAALDPKRHTIVSCASGVSMDEIRDAISADVGIYRIMPNTAASVNESITAITSNKDPLNREDEVYSLLGALGETIKINEALMESATILGACGIAYVLRFMRAMIQGGIQVGFDSKTATSIVSHTIKGAAELIIQNETHPEQEIDKVTTPKGCTIVGLNEMEHAGFSSSLIKGIVASYGRIENS